MKEQLLGLINILRESCTKYSDAGESCIAHEHEMFDNVDDQRLDALVDQLGTPNPPSTKWVVYNTIEIPNIEGVTDSVLVIDSIHPTEELADNHCYGLCAGAVVVPFKDYTL